MLERRGDMAFGIARGEQVGYVGWVASDALARAADEPPGWDVKWVGARQTHAYSEPDFKAPERITLSHLSIVEVGPQSGRFTQTKLGWIPTVHLTGKDLTDPVEAASIYLGTPYLWGGNSCFGIDCSGLVQAACFACGIPSPGDSDQQARQLGEELPEGEPVKRGDLLCWKGHVAWVADEATILHANAHHMAVALEGMNEAIARIEAQGDGSVTTRKRLRELT